MGNMTTRTANPLQHAPSKMTPTTTEPTTSPEESKTDNLVCSTCRREDISTRPSHARIMMCGACSSDSSFSSDSSPATRNECTNSTNSVGDDTVNVYNTDTVHRRNSSNNQIVNDKRHSLRANDQSDSNSATVYHHEYFIQLDSVAKDHAYILQARIDELQNKSLSDRIAIIGNTCAVDSSSSNTPCTGFTLSVGPSEQFANTTAENNSDTEPCADICKGYKHSSDVATSVKCFSVIGDTRVGGEAQPKSISENLDSAKSDNKTSTRLDVNTGSVSTYRRQLCDYSKTQSGTGTTFLVGRKLATRLLVFFTACQFVTSACGARGHRGIDMCEPIEIPMCTMMPYNMTRMPNHLHHSTQENARLAIEPYGELVKQNCSADMLFFLCAMFAPICTPHFQKEAIPPCRSVCERARQGCEPVMNKYNFSWPDDLDCNRLPEYDKGVCVSPEAIVSSMPEGSTANNKDTTLRRHKPKPDCKPCKRNKPRKDVYKAGKYDYAIGAMVKSITTVETNRSVIRVIVRSVLQRGKVHIQQNRLIDLWSESACVCPALRTNREYLIIGHEDVMLNMLKFTEKSLVSRWSQKWEKKDWLKPKRRRRPKNRKKKQCKGKNIKECRRKQALSRRLKCRVKKQNKSKTRIRCRSIRLETLRRRRKNKQKQQKKRKNDIKRNDTENPRLNINTVTNQAG